MTFEQAVSDYFTKDPAGKIYWQRFYSPGLVKTLTDEMRQSSLPTVTAANICFVRLVQSGAIERTDGKTEQDDAIEYRDWAEKNLAETIASVAAAPLTTAELENFGSLSQRDLSDLYWGEDGDGITDFAVRYNKACHQYGFVIPARFKREQR